MAYPKIITTYNAAIKQIAILEKYRLSSVSLEPKYQHFIAEVILLRLFSILESTIRDTALKAACSSAYRNGSIPSPIIACISMSDARNKFQNYNRTRTEQLKWTKVTFINQSVNKVLQNSEPFLVNLSPHGPILNEMRQVRNHIAHSTSSTYRDYKNVIIHTFGASLKIKTGAFLTSTKRLSHPKIDQYLSASKILINDITHG